MFYYLRRHHERSTLSDLFIYLASSFGEGEEVKWIPAFFSIVLLELEGEKYASTSSHCAVPSYSIVIP